MVFRSADGFIMALAYGPEHRHGIRPVERQVLRLPGVADFLAMKTVR